MTLSTTSHAREWNKKPIDALCRCITTGFDKKIRRYFIAMPEVAPYESSRAVIPDWVGAGILTVDCRWPRPRIRERAETAHQQRVPLKCTCHDLSACGQTQERCATLTACLSGWQIRAKDVRTSDLPVTVVALSDLAPYRSISSISRKSEGRQTYDLLTGRAENSMPRYS